MSGFLYGGVGAFVYSTSSSLWQGTQSLSLGGTDEYITLGTTVGDIAQDEPFSASAWFKGSDTGGQNWIFTKFNNTSGAAGWMFSVLNTGSVRLYKAGSGGNVVQRNSSVPTVDSVLDGVWHHLAVTCDGGYLKTGIKVYIDGAAVSTYAGGDGTSHDPSNSYEAMIGGRDGGTAPRTHSLRDVAVAVGTEWSAAQITAIYNSGVVHDLSQVAGLGLTSYWECGASGDDATGGTGVIQDLVGGYNGTPQNTEAGDLVADVP